jgi:hypothetical protein
MLSTLNVYSVRAFFVSSVMRICSRTRDQPACVSPANNNFICVFIAKRDKRMRDAGRCAGRYPATEHQHEWACLQLQCPFYSRMGHTLRIILTIVNTVKQTRRKLKLETAYHPQRAISRVTLKKFLVWMCIGGLVRCPRQNKEKHLSFSSIDILKGDYKINSTHIV